jgi:hypothetical protein
MSSRLINVRLDEGRLRKALELRRQGVALSDVVREAIDERYARLQAPATRDAADIVRRLFEEHPDPAGLPARDYDVHDRQAARRAIRQRLGPRRA